jgi:CelD/BcsL family acetyltransferase involved in cellulose biosynthesis
MTALASASPRQWRAYWRPLDALAALADEWRDLALRTREPNVFYEPDFALAAAPVFGAEAGAVLVRGSDGVLRGIFPAQPEPHRYGVAPALLCGWTHAYAPLGLPLVDRDHAEGVIDAWLNHLARERGARLLLLPLLPEQGVFADALRSVLEYRRLSAASFGRHERAALIPAADRAGYPAQAMSGKLRKELSRKRRRLADLGEVRHESAGDVEGVRAFLDGFLSLEQTGWKGRAGTAAAARDATREFLQGAVLGLARRGQARLDRLSLAGRPVAVTILLRRGAAAWLWKIAYDENFARYSPGVQLARDLTAALLDDNTLAAVDSCAVPDHPMIDRLWRERIALSDRLIALQSGDGTIFRIACSLESLRRTAIGATRTMRDTFRHLRAG